MLHFDRARRSRNAERAFESGAIPCAAVRRGDVGFREEPKDRSVRIGGAVTTDTVMTWTPQPGVAQYKVWWRDTTAPQWQHSRTYAAGVDPGHAVLKNIDLDDFFFGVSATFAPPSAWCSARSICSSV